MALAASHRLEAAEQKRAAADQARLATEQAVRNSETALHASEARSLALSGELATASGLIRSLDNDVGQLRFALAIANAPSASKEVQSGTVLLDP